MRDYRLYLDDILKAVQKIEKYTKGTTFPRLKKDDLLIDGVVRNLEIIGEATKKIPAAIKKDYPDIEWKKIAGLRDILAHEYFGIDIDILWDIIRNKLPGFESKIKRVSKSAK